MWYSPATFHHNFSLQVYATPFQWTPAAYFHKKKNLWRRVLEAKKKQVLWKAILRK